jgi:Spy/CpxP family protein refolding chaperone
MRTLYAALTLAAAMGVGSIGIADDTAKGRANGRGQDAQMQDLNLTSEQEAKIADIRKEAGPKVQEAAKELAALVKEEVEKVRHVLTPAQMQKLQALHDERKEDRAEGLAEKFAHLKELDLTDSEHTQIQDVRKEFQPKIVKALEGLRGILTDDQKKARSEALSAGKKHSELLASLKLTDEQKEKVPAIFKDLGTLVREETEKLLDVVGAEQKEKLAELKDERHERVRDRMACAIANFKSLELTEEQKTKIAEIRTEFRPKVHEAGNKLRAAVREEVGAIVAVLKG